MQSRGIGLIIRVIKFEVSQITQSAYINITPDWRTDGHTSIIVLWVLSRKKRG